MTSPTHEDVLALAKETRINDGTGTLYVVCRQAILDGEGTPERVREIWREATDDCQRDLEHDLSL